MIKFKKLHG